MLCFAPKVGGKHNKVATRVQADCHGRKFALVSMTISLIVG
jgi:hypothetical protein